MLKILGLVVLGSAIASASASLLTFSAPSAPRQSPQRGSHLRAEVPSVEPRGVEPPHGAGSSAPRQSPQRGSHLRAEVPSVEPRGVEPPHGAGSSALLLTANRSQQQLRQTENAAPFGRITKYAVEQNLHQRPMREIMQAIAVAFLGTPYKAGLLDQSSQETLVVTLNKFDCVLFVETVLAIARGVAVQDYSYQTFVDRIRSQRYWNGYMNGYCSRLHYFSEWIADNHRRGSVQNITRSLGGVALNKKLNFMSKHRGSYPRLVSNEANYKCIVEMEANLKATFDYIPQSQIRRVYAQLQPGDIVAIATNIAGLDVTHTGLVYRHPDGNIGLIHASPIGKVTISRDLQRYVGNVKNAIGIIVARPIAPRERSQES